MLTLFKSAIPAKASSPSPFLHRRKRETRRRFPTHKISFAIKPTDDKDAEEKAAELVNEDDLPEYVPDPLMNMGPPDEDVDVAKLDPEQRMTRIIVDLVNAGSLFEDKLEEYRDYLNVDLLERFLHRIEWAERHEDASAGEGLRMIWRRVCAEVERQSASPSLRLLDQLLGLLHPSAGGTSQERNRNALGLMYEAFTQVQADGVDIFGIAEALADGVPPPSDLLGEFVQKEEFIREVEEILDSAEASEAELRKKKELLLQERIETNGDQRIFKALSKQLDALDRVMDDRQRSLRDVKTLLDMAKTI